MGDVDTASVRLGGKSGRCVSARWMGDADVMSKRGWMEDVDNVLLRRYGRGSRFVRQAVCSMQFFSCSLGEIH